MLALTRIPLGPYAAAALFVLALALRCLRARGRLAELPAEAAQGWAALRGGRAFRLAVAVLVAGHLLGAVAPGALLRWEASPPRLWALEALAFAAGVAALAGWAALWIRTLWRRSGTLADATFLTLFGLALATGLAAAVLHRWASAWGAIVVVPWAHALLRGQPPAELAGRLPLLAQLHLAAGLAALAVVPLTRLGPALALIALAPIRAVGAGLAAANRALRVRTRWRGWADRIWPEED